MMDFDGLELCKIVYSFCLLKKSLETLLFGN